MSSASIPGSSGRGNHLVYEGWEDTGNSHNHKTGLAQANFSQHSQKKNRFKPENPNFPCKHLSRVSRAGLCDIAVVHSIAATVTSWKKLERNNRYKDRSVN